MVVYPLEQRLEILRHYFENHGNVTECVRKLRTDFVMRTYVRYLVKKVKETGILIIRSRREKPKTVRKPENIAAAESVCEAPSTSIHRRSQQLNILETSLKRILQKELGMMPHKVQLVQELKPINHPMHFRFAKLAFDQLTEDADFGKKKKLSFEMKLILILAGM